ncbi:MAG: ATPase, partial [Bacteroidetes bacterium CG_4_10_14_3_um_filter_42_6]
MFGKLATDQNFTNRKAEIIKLKQNFISGINTILISPRRWGKSSLVKKAGIEVEAEQKSIRIIYLDMFNIRTEEEFYKCLSEAVLKAGSGKLEESLSFVRKFLKQWIPRITVSPDAVQEMSLSLNWEEVKNKPDEILDLAESIAIEKELNLVICIDEFQNLSNFKDPLGF